MPGNRISLCQAIALTIGDPRMPVTKSKNVHLYLETANKKFPYSLKDVQTTIDMNATLVHRMHGGTGGENYTFHVTEIVELPDKDKVRNKNYNVTVTASYTMVIPAINEEEVRDLVTNDSHTREVLWNMLRQEGLEITDIQLD